MRHDAGRPPPPPPPRPTPQRTNKHPLIKKHTRNNNQKSTKREWPFEDLVPGLPKNDPPYQGMRQKGHKRELRKEERQQRIAESMAKMPQLIAEYRVREGGRGGG